MKSNQTSSSFISLLERPGPQLFSSGTPPVPRHARGASASACVSSSYHGIRTPAILTLVAGRGVCHSGRLYPWCYSDTAYSLPVIPGPRPYRVSHPSFHCTNLLRLLLHIFMHDAVFSCVSLTSHRDQVQAQVQVLCPLKKADGGAPGKKGEEPPLDSGLDGGEGAGEAG